MSAATEIADVDKAQHDKAVAFELMMARPAEGRLVMLRHQDLDLKCIREISVYRMERDMRIRHAERATRKFQANKEKYRQRKEELMEEKLLTHQEHGPDCPYFSQLYPEAPEQIRKLGDETTKNQKPRPGTMGAPRKTTFLTEVGAMRAQTAPDASERLPTLRSSLPSIQRVRSQHNLQLQRLDRRIKEFNESANPGDDSYKDSVHVRGYSTGKAVASMNASIKVKRRKDLYAAVRETQKVIDSSWKQLTSKKFEGEKLKEIALKVRKAKLEEERARKLSFDPFLAVHKASKKFMKTLRQLIPLENVEKLD